MIDKESTIDTTPEEVEDSESENEATSERENGCLLYTSDAADEP